MKGRTAANTLNIVKKNSSVFIFLVIVSSKREREMAHMHCISNESACKGEWLSCVP